MTVAAVQPRAAPLPSVPAPPADATPYERGPYDVAVLACLNAITPALQPGFGRLDFNRLIVPADLSWDRVTAHYAAALPASAGWAVDRTPEQQASCHLRAWSNGSAHVAVALTDEAFGPPPFRVLAVITPAR